VGGDLKLTFDAGERVARVLLDEKGATLFLRHLLAQAATSRTLLTPEVVMWARRIVKVARENPPNLLLIPRSKTVRFPEGGKNWIFVTAVNEVLHIRVSDSDGKTVVDTDETKLPDKVQQIKALKERLDRLWPPHVLTWNEKNWLINIIASIVGHTQAAPPE
jgi:hypothetical protein